MNIYITTLPEDGDVPIRTHSEPKLYLKTSIYSKVPYEQRKQGLIVDNEVFYWVNRASDCDLERTDNEKRDTALKAYLDSIKLPYHVPVFYIHVNHASDGEDMLSVRFKDNMELQFSNPIGDETEPLWAFYIEWYLQDNNIDADDRPDLEDKVELPVNKEQLIVIFPELYHDIIIESKTVIQYMEEDDGIALTGSEDEFFVV